jgi:hypothetical protein
MKGIWIICLWAIAAGASAQNVPPQNIRSLSYRTGSEAAGLMRDLTSQPLELTTEAPIGVDLPKFTSAQPLFAQWITPMTPQGRLWLALDCRADGQPYETLYFDSNADGSLKDETPITARLSSQSRADFGPVSVTFRGKEGLVIYSLNLKFQDDGKKKAACAISACCYQGQLVVGDVNLDCVLVDYNANGTFDDRSADPGQSDRLYLRKNGQSDWGVQVLADCMAIDSGMCRVEISHGGSRICLTDATNMKFGKFRVPAGLARLSIKSERGRFIFQNGQVTGTLPTGRYSITDWTIEQKDFAGRTWRIQAYIRNDKGIFDIEESSEMPLAVGFPIVSKIDVKPSGKSYQLNHSFVGQLGEQFYITCDGRRPPPPRIHITNPKKSFSRVYSLKYG